LKDIFKIFVIDILKLSKRCLKDFVEDIFIEFLKDIYRHLKGMNLIKNLLGDAALILHNRVAPLSFGKAASLLAEQLNMIDSYL